MVYKMRTLIVLLAVCCLISLVHCKKTKKSLRKNLNVQDAFRELDKLEDEVQDLEDEVELEQNPTYDQDVDFDETYVEDEGKVKDLPKTVSNLEDEELTSNENLSNESQENLGHAKRYNGNGRQVKKVSTKSEQNHSNASLKNVNDREKVQNESNKELSIVRNPNKVNNINFTFIKRNNSSNNISGINKKVILGGCTYWQGRKFCNHHNFRFIKSKDKSCYNRLWYYICPRTVAVQPSMCDKSWFLKGCRLSCNVCGSDAYITARKRYQRKKSTCKIFKNGECIHWNYRRVTKPSSIFAVIKSTDLSTALNCKCTESECDKVKFCLTVKYRRNSDFSKTNVPSQMSVCISNTEEGRTWFPGKYCRKENTKTLNENYVSKVWLTKQFRFEANCTTLELLVRVIRGFDRFDINNITLESGECSSSIERKNAEYNMKSSLEQYISTISSLNIPFMNIMSIRGRGENENGIDELLLQQMAQELAAVRDNVGKLESII